MLLTIAGHTSPPKIAAAMIAELFLEHYTCKTTYFWGPIVEFLNKFILAFRQQIKKNAAGNFDSTNPTFVNTDDVL